MIELCGIWGTAGRSRRARRRAIMKYRFSKFERQAKVYACSIAKGTHYFFESWQPFKRLVESSSHNIIDSIQSWRYAADVRSYRRWSVINLNYIENSRVKARACFVRKSGLFRNCLGTLINGLKSCRLLHEQSVYRLIYWFEMCMSNSMKKK